MLVEIVKAIAGFLVVMALWLAVQHYLRRRMAAGRHCDMLEAMVHGCGNCSHHGGCGSGITSTERHQS
jgi:hypothetical protein